MKANLEMETARQELLIIHPGASLNGVIGGEDGLSLPGDKSLSHRAALLSALAEGESRIKNFLVSGVTEAMLAALTRLGVSWQLDNRTLTVQGVGLEPAANGALPIRSDVTLDCGNSATTLRLLAGALAAWGVSATLDGSPGLRRRPMRRITEPLQKMGVAISSADGCAPLVINRGSYPLRGMAHDLSVASAQVKSCLLLAALAADGETTISEPGPSRDHTERMLAASGVDVQCLPPHPSPLLKVEGVGEAKGEGLRWTTRLVPPSPLRLAPFQLTLPGDMSAAAFLIVAALITPGSQISLHGVGLNPTRTGLLDSLVEMGADIWIENRTEAGGELAGDLIVRSSRLQGVTVSGERVVRMIDEFPAFAVAAACASGRTMVRDAVELRHKESDRISALGEELRRLEVAFEETTEGFAIQGGPLRGGEVRSHGDHRLAMALAVAGLAAEGPVQVFGAEIIRESFPEFPAVLQALGGRLS